MNLYTTEENVSNQGTEIMETFITSEDLYKAEKTTKSDPEAFFPMLFIPGEKRKKGGKSKNKKKKSKKKGKKFEMEIYDPTLNYKSILDAFPFQKNIGRIPEYMILNRYHNGGLFFGRTQRCGINQYIGKPQDYDGHVLVVGGPGTHKSSGIAMPTLESFDGIIVAIDVKGELSHFWRRIRKSKRPAKIFRPGSTGGIFANYDPLYFIRRDTEENVVSNISELVNALIPLSLNDRGEFWKRAARKFLMAGIVYYLPDTELTFIEILNRIMDRSLIELINEIRHGENKIAKRLISSYFVREDLSDSEMLMDISEQLSLYLMAFVSDPRIQKALKPTENCIRWDEDINTHNIFISIPESKLDQWSNMIALMLTQLTRALERRPEKYTPDGRKQAPVLLLLDEFPRIGKLEVLANALSTLRSKNVTFCLFIQSLAQLDEIYGQNVRRIILDTCSYKAILNSNDFDSQKYFSELTGTEKVWKRSLSETINSGDGKMNYSRSLSESREPIIFPHEFATLQDEMLLLHPDGYCIVKKMPYFAR